MVKIILSNGKEYYSEGTVTEVGKVINEAIEGDYRFITIASGDGEVAIQAKMVEEIREIYSDNKHPNINATFGLTVKNDYKDYVDRIASILGEIIKCSPSSCL